MAGGGSEVERKKVAAELLAPEREVNSCCSAGVAHCDVLAREPDSVPLADAAAICGAVQECDTVLPHEYECI